MARRTNMWLVYADETGQRHYQPWQDVAEVGNLIDPETGQDMECTGWALPEDADETA